MRFTISTKPVFLKGVCLYHLYQSAWAKLCSIKNDPKFLVTKKRKICFSLRLRLISYHLVDLQGKSSACLANSGLMAEGKKSEWNHTITLKITDGKVVDISFCLCFSGSLVRADHLTTPAFSRVGIYNPSTGKIHVAM